MANAIIAYLLLDFNLIHRIYLMAPWTTPAPIGAYLVSAGDIWAPVLSVSLIILDIIIYYPFFKMYERICVEKEQSKDAETLEQERLMEERARNAAQ